MEVQRIENLNIVFLGHVDHGKSTMVGRLLADSQSLPIGKIEQIRAMCERNAKVFEYAFLIDALESEKDQGITVDIARCFFRTQDRQYTILDAPGHNEFLKNMVTGASRAEAAILVIDANEGIRENSKKHGLLASMLGVKQLVVCVNKMDLVGYNQRVFERICREYSSYLEQLRITPISFIPVSAWKGENLVTRSAELAWYQGPTVLEQLSALDKEPDHIEQPFRMFLQDVYKFTAVKSDKRYFVGQIRSGQISPGDEVIFLPSKKKSKIAEVEIFGAGPLTAGTAGQSVGLTLTEQIYIKRGELIAKTSEPLPLVSTRFRANLFWMGRQPMTMDKTYQLKIGTLKAEAKLIQVNHVINSDQLDEPILRSQIDRHDVADCILETVKPIAFDLTHDNEMTGRFVLVDQYEISGGGIIREALETSPTRMTAKPLQQDLQLVRGNISTFDRTERMGQTPTLIVITGPNQERCHSVASKLEEILFRGGRFVYYLGMESVKHHALDEHLRRLSETAYWMLEAGLITIVTASDLDHSSLTQIDSLLSDHGIMALTFGSRRNFRNELNFSESADELDVLAAILEKLQHERMVFSR